jgi:endonuclease YncB( thermonuclease family)
MEAGVTRLGRVVVAALVACGVAAGPGAAQPVRFVNGTVAHVVDGDTLAVQDAQGDLVTIRLSGVDTPEKPWKDRWRAQPFSAQATRFTTELVAGRDVTVRLKPDETHGRAVGEVFVDGRSLNRELLRAGLGWWNRKYEPHDHDLQRLEAEARAARRGLWSERDPVPPWQHRRARK